MKVNKFVSWTHEGEKFVVINTVTQKCLVLDDTGKMLWNMVLVGFEKEEIADRCITQFPDSDPEVIKNDIEDFISLLKENDILETNLDT